MLLERFDPFLAEFDRLTNRAFGADGEALPMDVVRRGEDLVVRVDLPGVPADKIGLTVENQTLTLSVERHTTFGDGEQVLLQERFDGTMTRRLRIPDWADAENITADYTDGVLTLTMKVAEKARARRIEVRRGTDQPQIAS
ncbi:MAG TPA: Hsp20/alpha crystallin family protein [Mycobacteriales bacterium]|jgi:HSP20 family protein|nr:Hsp20/alpha crystallin family protein [Mycobacteriales bacterium]